MNVKTFSQQGPCVGLEIKGTVSTDGLADICTVDHSIAVKKLRNEESDVTRNNFYIQKSLLPVINHRNHENLKNGSQSGGNTSFKAVDNGLEEHSHLRLVKESKQEVAELDVERVLEEQDTHDLFCPNCNSCITKRVILRKRKRKIQNTQYDVKREKIETVVKSGVVPTFNDHDIDESGLDDSPTPATDNQDHDTGADIFRCLSCFSFFIPTGSGFKLFRLFGGSDEGENIHCPPEMPSKNLNCFSFILESIRGNGTDDDKNATISSLPTYGESHLTMEVKILAGKLKKDEQTSLVVSTEGAVFLEETQIDIEEKQESATKKNGKGNDAMQNVDKVELFNPSTYSDITRPYVNNDTISKAPGSQLADHANNKKQVDVSKGKPLIDGNDILISSAQDAFLLQDGQVDTRINFGDVPRKDNAGGDAILLVKAGPVEPGASYSAHNIPVPAGPVILLDEPVGVRDWDIIKSIVYGGLTETITSLGVVSSAASSGATTLNIITLGLANLIGGLFIITHGLKELKNNQYRGANGHMDETVDRYQEVLGRRENFKLHATLALLSYIIFGLLAPVTYGFSFRDSDNKEYKLIAVMAASLLCIILLAIGKAQVRKPPKSYVKTLMYYVSAGLMVSGLSYVAGELMKKLLEKLGLFEPSEAVVVLPSSASVETMSMKPAWLSY